MFSEGPRVRIRRVRPRRAWSAGLLALAASSAGCQKSAAVDCPPPPPLVCPDGGAPSFAGDVYPNVIEPVCGNCHKPGGQEPTMPFLTYQQIYGQNGSEAHEIYTQVFASCLMPPSNAPAPLTDAGRQTLVRLDCLRRSQQPSRRRRRRQLNLRDCLRDLDEERGVPVRRVVRVVAALLEQVEPDLPDACPAELDGPDLIDARGDLRRRVGRRRRADDGQSAGNDRSGRMPAQVAGIMSMSRMAVTVKKVSVFSLTGVAVQLT